MSSKLDAAQVGVFAADSAAVAGEFVRYDSNTPSR
jgi:hypothetical protein